MPKRFRMIPPHTVLSRVSILAETEDYNIKLMNIPSMWRETMGEGCRVVVLDTGLPKHSDLEPLGGKSFIDGYLHDLNGHGCVAPDTRIQTNVGGIETIESLYTKIGVNESSVTYADGTVSKIKDVTNLDITTYALDENTGLAVVAQVEYLHKTPITGKVNRILLTGGIEYVLTPWHEVCILKHAHHDKYYVMRKRADELVAGDRLIAPAGPCAGKLSSELTTVYGAWHRKCAACGHVLTQFKTRTVRCQCKRCGKSTWIEYRNSYVVGEDLAYLAGIVLTDGHIVYGHNYRVEVTSMDGDILEGILIIAARLGFDGIIDTPKKGCKRVLINSKELVSILINMGILLHRKSYDQPLPVFVGKSPRNVTAAFIAGVIDGDGYVSITNSKNRITTASKEFAFGMAALLNSLGVSCGVANYGKSTGFSKAATGLGATIYNCTFTAVPEDIARYMRCGRKQGRAAKKVTGIRKARRIVSNTQHDYAGVFYDLTVKDHHTYIGNGHFVSNTHCAGIIAATAYNDMGVCGIAPNIEDYYGAVLDGDGSGAVDDIIRGIRWAVDDLGAHIISMSLGMPAGMPHSRELEAACNYAVSRGCTVIAAAGNEGGSVGQPAIYDSVIAVAAVDNRLQHAAFSNMGGEVDFAAGGVNVYSTYLNNGYAKLSGTSMACPALVGVAALIVSKHLKEGVRLTPTELRAHIQRIAYDVGKDGFDELYGNGIPIFGNTAPLEPDAGGTQPKPAGPKKPTFWGWLGGLFKKIGFKKS